VDLDLRRPPARASLEYISLLSHALMNPLAGIVLWCEMLLAKRRLPKVVQRGLRAVDRSARAQVAILDNFVELARVQAGVTDLERDSIDVVACIHDAIGRTKSASLQHEARVHFAPMPGACTVSGDAGRLCTALYNVLDNAIAASPPKGRIDVVLELSLERVSIRVTDQGAGMLPEVVAAAFTLGELAARPTPGHGVGFGLGLPIARFLVELHGGTIDVRSGAPAGCAVTVTLPRATA
jgi:two-component system CheB/CheR fusion protein